MTTATIAKPEAKKVTKAEKSPQQFVTTEQFEAKFSAMTELMGKVVESVTAIEKKTATPVQASEAAEVAKAKHDQAPLNPAWDEKAREIIGEAVDHCEVFYPRNGGTIFTVVIKSEFSNAPKEYLERMKSDRRSREIGPEGIAGVETWCKLVRQNLKRSQAK